MSKKDYIKMCRYYKGEKTTTLTGNDAMFWNIERTWVESSASNTGVISSMLDDYFNAGLRTFNEYDDTPLTLKAVIFGAYSKYHSGTMKDAARGFKLFYKGNYLKE